MSTHPASATKSLVIREPVDLIALAPGKWPRHIPDAWQGG